MLVFNTFNQQFLFSCTLGCWLTASFGNDVFVCIRLHDNYKKSLFDRRQRKRISLNRRVAEAHAVLGSHAG